MKLELQYHLGDKVYVVYKENDGIVRVFKDEISSVTISKKYGILYCVDGMCEDFKVEELIPFDRSDLLVARIDRLLIEEDVKAIVEDNVN